MNNISYIDRSRIAVWGWSYGGYLAGQLLAEDNQDLLACAVSVAPVVQWQLYGKDWFLKNETNFFRISFFIDKLSSFS